MRKHADLKDKLTRIYRQAQRKGLLRPGLSPALAAADTLIFLSGLMKIWVIDEDSALVQKDARRLIADHIAGKQCPVEIPVRAQSRRTDAKKVSIA